MNNAIENDHSIESINILIDRTFVLSFNEIFANNITWVTAKSSTSYPGHYWIIPICKKMQLCKAKLLPSAIHYCEICIVQIWLNYGFATFCLDQKSINHCDQIWRRNIRLTMSPFFLCTNSVCLIKAPKHVW